MGARKLKEDEGWIPVGYLWARTIPCQNPACGAEIPLVKQFWLAKKKNKRIAYRPVVDKANERVDFELLEDAEAIEAADFDPSEGTVSRADARCPVCGQITKANDTRRLAREGLWASGWWPSSFTIPTSSASATAWRRRRMRRLYAEAEARWRRSWRPGPTWKVRCRKKRRRKDIVVAAMRLMA